MDACINGIDQAMLSQGEQTPQASGLRAPCVTTLLTAQDLAQVSEGEEDGVGVLVEPRTHGFIDEVDSKLVTDLQKKLRFQQSSVGSDFQTHLSAALDRQLAEQAQFRESLDAPQTELSGTYSDTCYESGLRAPRNTAKLSPEILASLDDDVPDSSVSHGQIDQINDAFVTQLHRKLENQSSSHTLGDRSGLHAPQNTEKLTADMMRLIDDVDDNSIGEIDLHLVTELQRRLDGGEDESAMPMSGCIAPQSTMKLNDSMLQDLDN
mmetsp:Transcript_64209/g.101827  ORF Transcript_64209/g.101827 Transcript_64209/m.101827 type:complete len:265 (-) Transcript_64209:32-826(-)